jgi:tRNA dimethylallyltransferase
MSLPHPAPRMVVIVGPTASGKSALALDLARAIDGDIVSADSQQVYRGMDIGTAKASPAERLLVPHHLLDVVDPDDEMTAARFVALADQVIAELAARGRPIIVAGGTMLYVRVLLCGLFEAPGADPALRARLADEVAEHGSAALHARLAEVDPAAAARILPGDARRIIRALEVLALTGETMSAHQARHDFRRLPSRYPVRLVGLLPDDRDALYQRIDQRVDQMLAAGLVDEVAGLRARGIRPPLRSQAAIGYREIHRHLDGDLDLGEAARLIKRNSRRYARRQVSWYRAEARVEWHAQAADVDLSDLCRYLRDL